MPLPGSEEEPQADVDEPLVAQTVDGLIPADSVKLGLSSGGSYRSVPVSRPLAVMVLHRLRTSGCNLIPDEHLLTFATLVFEADLGSDGIVEAHGLLRQDDGWTVRLSVRDSVPLLTYVIAFPSRTLGADVDLLPASPEDHEPSAIPGSDHTGPVAHESPPPVLALHPIEMMEASTNMAASGVVGSVAYSAVTRVTRLLRPASRRTAPPRDHCLEMAHSLVRETFGVALPKSLQPQSETFSSRHWTVQYVHAGHVYDIGGEGTRRKALTVSRRTGWS